MVKFASGVFLPDREEYLIRDIEASPQFAGGGTVQFRKFQVAFSSIRNFRHAVDIGSNAGIWARVLARCFGKLTCFEPNPECKEAFWRNINHPGEVQCSVTLHECAIGSHDADLPLNTGLKSTAFSHIDISGDIVVPIRTLDSFELQEVDFLKIDVEGYEYNVIIGAVETIKRCKPVIIIEQKPNNAERFGFKQFSASKLVQKLGGNVVANVGGDVIINWNKKK